MSSSESLGREPEGGADVEKRFRSACDLQSVVGYSLLRRHGKRVCTAATEVRAKATNGRLA